MPIRPFIQPAAGAGRGRVRETVGRGLEEPRRRDLGVVVLVGVATPLLDDEHADVVALALLEVAEGAVEADGSGDLDARLFAELAGDGLFDRLAALDPAAGEVPRRRAVRVVKRTTVPRR